MQSYGWQNGTGDQNSGPCPSQRFGYEPKTLIDWPILAIAIGHYASHRPPSFQQVTKFRYQAIAASEAAAHPFSAAQGSEVMSPFQDLSIPHHHSSDLLTLLTRKP